MTLTSKFFLDSESELQRMYSIFCKANKGGPIRTNQQFFNIAESLGLFETMVWDLKFQQNF